MSGDGRTKLHYAALDGDAETVRDLLANGADPNAQLHRRMDAVALEFPRYSEHLR